MVIKRNFISKIFKNPLIVLLSVFVFAWILVYYKDFSSAISQAEPWMNPIVTKEEVKAIGWVKQNTNERETFVTDIFAGELIMGGSLREGTEGGDWAVVPNVIEKMSDINEFYKTNDAEQAYKIAKKWKAKYAVIPNRQIFAGFEWFYAEKSKMGDKQLFRLIYEDSGYQIYEMR